MVILGIVALLTVGALITGIIKGQKRRYFSLLCAVLSLAGVFTYVGKSPEVYRIALWMNPVELSFRVDNLSVVISLLAALLFTMALLYSGYIKVQKFYSLLLLDLAVVLLAIFSETVLFFYIFLEMSTIITYFLIIHRGTPLSMSAGFKYVVMNVGGAVLILLAIVIGEPPYAPMLFVAGCLVKMGSIPFHVWVADAHPQAPTPVSAVLSGVMVKLGVYAVIRFAPVFSLDASVVVPFALVSMVGGVILALIQKDIKRILAYHTVSQVGIIVLGIGLENEAGLEGALLHMVNHGVFKGLLFFSVGCVIYATAERNVQELGGLLSQMPLVGAACLIGCLSISGVFPFNGYVSKTLLFHAVSSGWVKGIFFLTCAGTVASFTKLFRHTFLGDMKKSPRPVPVFMKVPLVILSGLCLGLGVFQAQEYNVWTGSAVTDCVMMIGTGLLLYYAAWKTKILFNTPEIPLTLDKFFIQTGKLVEKVGVTLNDLCRNDINHYVAFMVVTVLFFLFWVTF
jgi:multicomponent Na+:H+ antiporter subunit D